MSAISTSNFFGDSIGVPIFVIFPQIPFFYTFLFNFWLAIVITWNVVGIVKCVYLTSVGIPLFHPFKAFVRDPCPLTELFFEVKVFSHRFTSSIDELYGIACCVAVSYLLISPVLLASNLQCTLYLIGSLGGENLCLCLPR